MSHETEDKRYGYPVHVDLARRIEALEKSDAEMRGALQELIISTTVTNTTLDTLTKMLPKIEKIEMAIERSNMVINIAKWGAGVIATVGITMTMYYLFGKPAGM